MEKSKDDSSVFDDSLEGQSFDRNSYVRTAFRRKSSSRELSPERTKETAVTPKAGIREDDEVPLELDQQLSQGSRGSSQDERENPKLSVRQRTQKWELRGGGVPSYFTLPRSFRTKSRKGASSDISSPMSETSGYEFTDGSGKNHSRISVSGIARPVSRIPAPRSMSVSQSPAAGKLQHPRQGGSSGTRVLTALAIPKRASSASPTAEKSASPRREEADGSSDPDEALLQRSIEREMVEHVSSGAPSLPGKGAAAVTTVESPGSHQPIIKSKSVSAVVNKQRGQSLLPTKTQIPASSNVPVSTGAVLYVCRL